MRRAIATIFLTVAALVFILKFDPQKATSFASAAPTTAPPVAGQDTSTTTSTNAVATNTGATTTSSPPATKPESTTTEPPTTTTTTSTTTTTATSVIDGPVFNTQFGPVQVEVTVDGNTIVDVQALQLPSHARRSAQISNYVESRYRDAALQAQSADFWGISGATVTWWGYVHSLQAALDQAGI